MSATEGFEWIPDGRLLGRIGRALATLDLVVFVPLLRPDEITLPIEHPELRSRVDVPAKVIINEYIYVANSFFDGDEIVQHTKTDGY